MLGWKSCLVIASFLCWFSGWIVVVWGTRFEKLAHTILGFVGAVIGRRVGVVVAKISAAFGGGGVADASQGATA